MEVLPQALEITFEMQRKMSNEKITRNKKKNFPTYKTCFFFFFPPLWTPFIFKLNNFLISYSFQTIWNVKKAQPKVLQIVLEL
jgi:hypothetical protein